MICSWIDEAGSQCGEPAVIVWNLPLCEAHRASIFHRMRIQRNKLALEYWNTNPDSRHSYGITYIVKLANGNLKIGYTTKGARGLSSRWKDFSRDYGGRIEPLATGYGGLTREAYLHGLFSKYTIFGLPGEQFRDVPEIRAFAAYMGHCPQGVDAITEYARYKPKSLG